MKIKCIIFDFGNVLGEFDHMITCCKLADFSKFSPKEIHEKIFKSGLEKEFDEGKIGSSNFHKKVCEAILCSKLKYLDFFEIWGNIFSENKDIERILERIKPEIKILLLSNTNQTHWSYISQMPQIKKYFSSEDNQILSFRIGARKPDEKIFIETLKRCNCKPEEIIYIDDIPEYVEIFKKLGGNGIIYNCQINSPEKLEKELKKFGVLR